LRRTTGRETGSLIQVERHIDFVFEFVHGLRAELQLNTGLLEGVPPSPSESSGPLGGLAERDPLRT